MPLNDLAAAINSWSTSREGQMELAPSGLPKLMRPWAEVNPHRASWLALMRCLAPLMGRAASEHFRPQVPPPLAASRSQVVEFPAEDESVVKTRPQASASYVLFACKVAAKHRTDAVFCDVIGARPQTASEFCICLSTGVSGAIVERVHPRPHALNATPWTLDFGP